MQRIYCTRLLQSLTKTEISRLRKLARESNQNLEQMVASLCLEPVQDVALCNDESIHESDVGTASVRAVGRS